MKIAFFGTPELSSTLLQKLLSMHIPIELVVTQEDKPAGKRLEVSPSAVKSCALEHGIEIFDSELNQRSESTLIQRLQENSIDLCILFAYGRIISKNLLESIPHGFWNVHPSRLPLYRGASPTVFPILLGENNTGCTLIQMNEQLDEGDMIEQEMITIHPMDSRIELEHKLIDIAAKQLNGSLSVLQQGGLTKSPQKHASASYTRKIYRKDGFIKLDLLKQGVEGKQAPANELPDIFAWFNKANNQTPPPRFDTHLLIHRMVQALSPWPGVWTQVTINGKQMRLKILETRVQESRLEIIKLQLEGKPPVDFITFIAAYNIFGK